MKFKILLTTGTLAIAAAASLTMFSNPVMVAGYLRPERY